MTVLVDSSVWIEYLRGTGGPADRWILAAMRGNQRLAWTEPILFELLICGISSYTAKCSSSKVYSHSCN